MQSDSGQGSQEHASAAPLHPSERRRIRNRQHARESRFRRRVEEFKDQQLLALLNEELAALKKIASALDTHSEGLPSAVEEAEDVARIPSPYTPALAAASEYAQSFVIVDTNLPQNPIVFLSRQFNEFTENGHRLIGKDVMTDTGAVTGMPTQAETISTSQAALISNGKADFVLEAAMPPAMVSVVETKLRQRPGHSDAAKGSPARGSQGTEAAGSSDGNGVSSAAADLAGPLTTPQRYSMETLRGRGSRPVNVVSFIAPTAHLEAVGLAAAELKAKPGAA